MRIAPLIAGLAALLSACGSETSENSGALADNGFDPSQCVRNAEGQIACVREAFAINGCKDLKPIGTMYKDGVSDAFAHLSAFDASEACLAEAKQAAQSRGFTERAPGEFFLKTEGGYSELLSLSDQGTLQWERQQL